MVETLQAADGLEAKKEANLDPGDDQQKHIDGVVQHEVADDDAFEDPNGGEHGLTPPWAAAPSAVAGA
jgi:hypothetical protein